MTVNQTAQYLNYSFKLTDQEKAVRKGFEDWLPDKIIDCHCHCNIVDHTNNINPGLMNHPASTFSYFNLQHVEQMKQLLFPGRSVNSLFFSLPLAGIDFVSANQYLTDNISASDRVALLGDLLKVDYTTTMLERKEISALKMYHLSVSPPAKSLYDFLKPSILEEAQALGKPVILHLPTPITSNMDDLLRMISDFPRLVILLAHLGLPDYNYPDLVSCYKVLSGKKNLFMDTSMVTSGYPIWAALITFGSERVLYGSDGPLNLIRGIKKTLPGLGQRIITSYPYHWSKKTDVGAASFFPADMIHFHWHNLLAIKEAIKRLGGKEQEIMTRVFYHNAKAVFSF